MALGSLEPPFTFKEDGKEDLLSAFVISRVENNSTPVDVLQYVQQLWPSLTLADIIRVVRILEDNSALLALADQQVQAPYGRGVKSSGLKILVRLIFGGDQGSDHHFGSENSDETWYQRACMTIVMLARALGLLSHSAEDTGKIPLPRISLPRTLSSSRQTCIQCESSLKSRAKPQSINVLELDGVKTGLMLRLDCSNRACRAKHYPDLVTIRQDHHRLAIYDTWCQYIKIGQNTYANRDVAANYTGLLETSYVTTAAFATSYGHIQSHAEGYTLRQDYIWRAFVLHAALQLAEESGEAFITQLGAPTIELVQGALQAYLGDTLLPGAMEHRCPDCSRYKRIWRTGAIAAGSARGQGDGAAELPSRSVKNYKEDTRVDRTQVVTMAVMDGIQLGHKKCAVPSCKLEPVDHRSERFCTEHAHYRALCGVVGCGKLVKKTAAGEKRSGACEGEEHQALWTQHEKRQIGGRVKGFSRIIRRRKRKREGLRQSPAPSLGSDFEHDASDFDQLDSDAEDESDQPDSDDGSEYKPALAPKRAPLTMWSFGRTAAVQILVHACGCPIAWRKLYEPEDEQQALDFLCAIKAASPSGLPSFIAYDRSCYLLKAIERRDRLHQLLNGTSLIVDAFHFSSHMESDILCQTFCNPAPLDGTAPDLVTPMVLKKRSATRERNEDESIPRERIFQRAFNTNAAEQLNSWLSGFGPMLRNMTGANHDFLLHIMLRRRLKRRAQEQAFRHGATVVG